MISLHTLVYVVVTLIVGGVVCALLWWLVEYVAKEWQAPELFVKVARTALAVAVVLFLIGVILHLAGRPVIVF